MQSLWENVLELTLKCSVRYTIYAGVAQLVEQLICNQLVGGSSPSIGSITCSGFGRTRGLSWGCATVGEVGWTVNPVFRLSRFESYHPHTKLISVLRK